MTPDKMPRDLTDIPIVKWALLAFSVTIFGFLAFALIYWAFDKLRWIYTHPRFVLREILTTFLTVCVIYTLISLWGHVQKAWNKNK